MDNEPTLFDLAKCLGRVEAHTEYLVKELSRQRIADLALDKRVKRLEGYAAKIAVIFTIVSFPLTYLWKKATKQA
jgi:hypothetical protein